MIDCIFTIDYEIYGNGEGGLNELIYEPARTLKQIFDNWKCPFVSFVEAAELEILKKSGTDTGIKLVEEQIREFYRDGFEIGLHLHPQWYNAKYQDQKWVLDYAEYNLCKLPRARIEEIVERSLSYLRHVIGDSRFTPVSFRAGNWLFQPTENAALVLAQKGFRIDSSVFKGGRQRNHELDYRPALRNGYFWRFGTDANVEDCNGKLLEIPTFTTMVPFWKMLTGKRVSLQRKSPTTAVSGRQKVNRYLDLLRPWYPLKFDFCRMTLHELTGIVDRAIMEDRSSPRSYKPLVAIGHTKDLTDFNTIEKFLLHLKERGIAVINLQDALEKCLGGGFERPSIFESLVEPCKK
jgi:hypothetical protein